VKRQLSVQSDAEMHRNDLEIACYQLIIYPNTKDVVQRRVSQKTKSLEKAIKSLLESNFILKIKYTMWLCNVILKWHIVLIILSPILNINKNSLLRFIKQ
jgi:hypothetical protein